MGIVLYRVDERLIHGQVVIGWGHELRPDRFHVVDDDLAVSDWEQDLYRLGAGEAAVLFTDVRRAREGIARWRQAPERSILLTRDIDTMARLAAGGLLAEATVNLGGIHPGPGRTEVLRYLHLTGNDRALLRRMAGDRVTITARELPDTPRTNLTTLLGD